MANAPLDTSLFDRAVAFALRAHAGTERRGKGFPYIIHPMEAAEIVATITPDQELLSAAVLHDTVEDTDVTVGDIRREFGDRIASVVEAETDSLSPGMDEAASWHDRKQKAIDRLKGAPRDVKIVALGDKLSNMRAIARDYAIKGDGLWKIFHVSDKAEHRWRFMALRDALGELDGTFAYKEFENLINQVFDDGTC